MVNVNFRLLEKSICVLEKSWKFASEIQCEPCYNYYKHASFAGKLTGLYVLLIQSLWSN